LLLVFALTIYYIFSGRDLKELSNDMRKADIRYWFAAVLCVLLFIGSESVIISYLMRTLRQKALFGHCLLYSFVGFFFCCITPMSAGGQPAQLYYMQKDHIPIPLATSVLLIITITYKMVLVIIGAFVLIFRPPEMIQALQSALGWCYLGMALNVICVGFMLLLVFHPTMAKSILTAIISLLSRFHLIKQADRYSEKIEQAMRQYQDVAAYFRTHKLVILKVLVLTIVQRLLLFYVTYLIYRSFGLAGTGFAVITILQGMISVAVEMLPLPGGMGISEKLFLTIFAPICGRATLPVMLVSRGISYYTQLIISALLTLIAHFVIVRKTERNYTA